MFDERVVRNFATSRYTGGGVPEISIAALRGGLETQGIARVSLTYNHLGKLSSSCFTVKRLPEKNSRELRIYQALHAATSLPIAPKLLGCQTATAGETYVFLEWIPAACRWPWRDPHHIRSAVQTLAVVHQLDSRCFAEALISLDYDAELRASAESTLLAYQASIAAGTRPGGRSMTRTIERLSGALPDIRHELTAFSGVAVLHGDLHSGNAVIRNAGGKTSAVLLDWGRARFGSPLEDLSSWLQSLRFWEFQARQKHDQFLRDYLDLAGRSGATTREFRDAYWLAAGCNAFAGALRYHLSVTQDPARTRRQREISYRAATDWLRILRRADACWRP